MGPWYYEVVSFDGDYVNLRRTDIASDELNPVALALLPPEIEVGSKIKCEYFQYEIIGCTQKTARNACITFRAVVFSCGSSDPARRANPRTGAGLPPHCG